MTGRYVQKILANLMAGQNDCLCVVNFALSTAKVVGISVEGVSLAIPINDVLPFVQEFLNERGEALSRSAIVKEELSVTSE